MLRGPGVFQVSAQRGVSEAHATVGLVILNLRQYPKALRIAFKIQEILALSVAQLIEQTAFSCLAEPVTNGVFA